MLDFEEQAKRIAAVEKEHRHLMKGADVLSQPHNDYAPWESGTRPKKIGLQKAKRYKTAHDLLEDFPDIPRYIIDAIVEADYRKHGIIKTW